MGNDLIAGGTGAFRDSAGVARMSGTQAGKSKIQKKKENKKQGNSIYVGNLRQNRNVVSEKFAMAQKRALKRVMDQFKEDLKLDEEMSQRSGRVEELRKEACEAVRQIKGLDENYRLTEEEKQRLAEMPLLTDYQRDMLECDEEEKKYRETLRSCRQDIAIENATIEATKKALLKVSPMADAQREADEIMENAYKEQIGSLFQQGVEKINDDIAQMQEDMAENKAEALEEKIQREKMKEDEADKEEAVQETILSSTASVLSFGQQAVENLQSNIKNLIQDQIVLDVDMKGLRVNKQL